MPGPDVELEASDERSVSTRTDPIVVSERGEASTAGRSMAASGDQTASAPAASIEATAGGGSASARVLSIEAVAVGLVALALSIPVLRWTKRSLDVPFDYGNDATFYLMIMRGMSEHGWHTRNPDLGVPYGQDMRDLAPGGDNAHFIVQWALAKLFSPGAAMNLFFLLTIVTVAMVAHVVLRRLGIGRTVAAVLALVYAYAPYHLLRRTGHLMLSSYAMVPIGVAIVLAIMSASPPLVGTRSGRWPGIRRDRRAIGVAVACVLLASTGSYYAFFVVYLAVVGAAVAAIARRSLRPLWSAAFVGAIVLVMTLVNTAESWLYWLRAGTNPEVAQRRAQETEEYGLRLQQLFMPRIGHRNPRLASIGYRAWGGPIYSEVGQQLGIIAALGLAGLLLIVAVVVVRRDVIAEGSRWQTLSHLGLLAVVAILSASIGGLSYLIALTGFTFIRAWNRISIVIAFMALVAVAFGIEWIVARVRARFDGSWTRLVLPIVLVVVGGAAWYDQTSPYDHVDRAGVLASWESDAAFFGAMDEALPDGVAVFELPLADFPEAPPPGRMGLYDHARGYVHAPSLRWSFGAMRGREPRWPAWDAGPPDVLVEGVRAAGFGAVLVDRFGYADGGAALEAALSTIVSPAGVSADGRYVWFDLARVEE